MVDHIIKAAMAKRDAAMAEVRRWEDFIRMYGEVASSEPQAIVNRPPSSDVRSESTSGVLADTEAAVMSILSNHGTPKNTRELLNLLREQGFDVGGKDPASTLSARLSRAPKLKNIHGKGWWIKKLADDDTPVAGTSSAIVERQVDHLTEPLAQGREAGPGGGT